MPTYVMLIRYTDQGIREVKELAGRRPRMRELVEKVGGKILSAYVTQGQYDGVLTVDFPNDTAATTFSLALGAMGRNRTETMRAYTLDEYQAIVEKLP